MMYLSISLVSGTIIVRELSAPYKCKQCVDNSLFVTNLNTKESCQLVTFIQMSATLILNIAIFSLLQNVHSRDA